MTNSIGVHWVTISEALAEAGSSELRRRQHEPMTVHGRHVGLVDATPSRLRKTMNAPARTVMPDLTFTEGARWRDGRLWFSDLYTYQVLSCLGDGSDLRVEATVPHQPSGLGWLADGRLLVVSMMDRTLMRREHDGTMVVHADLAQHAAGYLGDLVADDHGRAYLGNFGFDIYADEPMAPTSIHRVDPDGTITEVARDVWFPNGCAITPEGSLLVNETFGNRITAFDLTEGGDLVNRRVWAQFGPLPTSTRPDEALKEVAVAPDGCCLDAEGGLWIADIRNNRAVRVVEGGAITDEVRPGENTNVFAVALGGEDGRTLFLCTAPDFDVETRQSTRAASVMAVRVRVSAWPDLHVAP
ncbi:SMP-30/gluconolactonase/LRE family protein [Nocardioides sp. NBC_00850]|uniref:SMP-30/gluconolactonase/LRE family protein n=1 Tax=Nocardioides sp. NBC_00850 TaxID=2976001 RepID=UPI00386DDED4|nr:SMP-30/gluconolactonase/LRE family protein [Nocardioides sp. NBC_00850]